MLRYTRLDKHLNVCVLSHLLLPVRVSLPLEQTRLTPESVLNDGLQFRAGGLDLRLAVGIDRREQIFDLDARACSPVSVCLKYATNPHLRSSTKFSDQARSRDRQVFPTPLA